MTEPTPPRRRTGLYILGCLGALVVVSCVAVLGAGGGYLAWQVWRVVEPTLTAQALAPLPPTQPITPGTLQVQRSPTPSRTPAMRPTPRPSPTPTQPTPTPGPAVIPDWPTYDDPGYIRFQYPPNWLVITTPEAPEYNSRSCHCYWIIMSEQMVQNWPSPEVVADWFNRRSVDDLRPGSVYIEILRLDSEYAPTLTFEPTTARVTIGGQYEADVYVTDEQGRIFLYHYRDQQGRPWVIAIRLPSGLDENNPQVRRMFGILWTIDHR